MAKIIDLKQELENSINAAFEIDGNQIRLKSELTIGDIMDLKSVESIINNILVVAQACAFADDIGEPAIKTNISNPNATGFDIKCEKILAELKATVPCDKNAKTGEKKYGANQANSISKDLENLMGLSDKATNLGINLANYKKYMVLIDVDGQRVAFESLLKKEKFRNSPLAVIPIYIDPEKHISDYDEFGWQS